MGDVDRLDALATSQDSISLLSAALQTPVRSVNKLTEMALFTE